MLLWVLFLKFIVRIHFEFRQTSQGDWIEKLSLNLRNALRFSMVQIYFQLDVQRLVSHTQRTHQKQKRQIAETEALISLWSVCQTHRNIFLMLQWNVIQKCIDFRSVSVSFGRISHFHSGRRSNLWRNLWIRNENYWKMVTANLTSQSFVFISTFKQFPRYWLYTLEENVHFGITQILKWRFSMYLSRVGQLLSRECYTLNQELFMHRWMKVTNTCHVLVLFSD